MPANPAQPGKTVGGRRGSRASPLLQVMSPQFMGPQVVCPPAAGETGGMRFFPFSDGPLYGMIQRSFGA